MKQNTKVTANTNKSEENIYLGHIEKDGWNDIRAYHIQNESMWRNIAILIIIIAGIIAVYAMYIVNQDKHKVLIFEKNSNGSLTALGIATKSFGIDNKIIAHQLANFIIALRGVPLDIMVKKNNINLVHNMIDSKLKSTVDKLIIDQYRKSRDASIIVDITSIKPLSGGTSWEISWVETILGSADPNFNNNSSWSTTVTFKHLNVLKPEVQLINPAGLFITYLHPMQDINSKRI